MSNQPVFNISPTHYWLWHGFFLTAGKLMAFRFVAELNFIWVILVAFAIWFKSNNYFGKTWGGYLIWKTIYFQWGMDSIDVGGFFVNYKY